MDLLSLFSKDIVRRPLFIEQQMRSLIDCPVLCIQIKMCLSVYFDDNKNQCYLNNDFLPGHVLKPSYTPSDTVDLLGSDPRGLVSWPLTESVERLHHFEHTRQLLKLKKSQKH